MGDVWQDKIENEKLWEMCGQETIERQILERKWRWIGHRGRPRKTWRRSVLEEAERMGKSWEKLKGVA